MNKLMLFLFVCIASLAAAPPVLAAECQPEVIPFGQAIRLSEEAQEKRILLPPWEEGKTVRLERLTRVDATSDAVTVIRDGGQRWEQSIAPGESYTLTHLMQASGLNLMSITMCNANGVAPADYQLVVEKTCPAESVALESGPLLDEGDDADLVAIATATPLPTATYTPTVAPVLPTAATIVASPVIAEDSDAGGSGFFPISATFLLLGLGLLASVVWRRYEPQIMRFIRHGYQYLQKK